MRVCACHLFPCVAVVGGTKIYAIVRVCDGMHRSASSCRAICASFTRTPQRVDRWAPIRNGGRMRASGRAMSMIDFDVERLNHKIFIRFAPPSRPVSDAARAASNRAYCTHTPEMKICMYGGIYCMRGCGVLNAVVSNVGLACRTD